MSAPTKADFLLDPTVHFLNHGSFGACPRPVFEAYQQWQAELERQPVEFLGRRAGELLAASRAALAAYLGIAADDLVYFPNPTTAINAVARNVARLSGSNRKGGARPIGTGTHGDSHPGRDVLGIQARKSAPISVPLQNLRSVFDPADSPLRLQPGDEILTTDHEYGAMDRTWRYLCDQTGIRYVQQPIPLPVTTHADFVERFWTGVTPRTRIIFISHITSATALTFPAVEICRRARQAGILTIVDGAHAPGQIPLNLAELSADIYTGACHKWLCAPKGTAFLYVRRELQPWLEPLIVSWGWESDKPGPSPFVDWHEWQGTRDLAAYLSVPAAIRYQAEHDWDAVRERCHALAVETRQRIEALTGLPAICPDDTLPQSGNREARLPDAPDAGSAEASIPVHSARSTWFTQFFAARLPECDLDALKARLYAEDRVEVPIHRWNGIPLVRVSFQAYNDRVDADALLAGLARLLPERS